MTDPGEDLELALAGARRGDGRGFDVLYRTFAGAVAGYLRARDASDPDGLTNDVFLRAFRTIHTFRGDSRRFRAWVFTIAHNTAIDDARRRRRRPPEVGHDGTADVAGGDVEAEVMARLAQERVDALLGELSTDQRDVLTLRVVADLSVEETAAVLGKSYEAVKALQRRGLAALRRGISARQGVPR